MKKGLLIAAVLCTTLLLTGCGGKESKLVCTMQQTQMGMKMDTTATTYFNSKGKATKVDMDMVVNAKDESTAKTLAKTMKSSYDNVTQKGSKVIIKETIKNDGSDKDVTIKDARKQFKDQGFTCK